MCTHATIIGPPLRYLLKVSTRAYADGSAFLAHLCISYKKVHERVPNKRSRWGGGRPMNRLRPPPVPIHPAPPPGDGQRRVAGGWPSHLWLITYHERICKPTGAIHVEGDGYNRIMCNWNKGGGEIFFLSVTQTLLEVLISKANICISMS